MSKWTVDQLPDEALPGIDDLTGDMHILVGAWIVCC